MEIMIIVSAIGIVIILSTYFVKKYVDRKNDTRNRQVKNKSNKNVKIETKDIVRDIFKTQNIEKNIVKKTNGENVVVLKYRTKDHETLSDREVETLEKNLFNLSKKFKGSIKVHIKESRQDLYGLQEEIKKSLENNDFTESAREFGERYISYIKSKNMSRNESQLVKYIVIASEDPDELMNQCGLFMQSLKDADIEVTILGRNETIENFIESVHHRSREKFNPDLNVIDQIAPECFEEQSDYLYLGKNKYCRIYGAISMGTFSRIGLYDNIYKDLGQNVEMIFDLTRYSNSSAVKILKKEKTIARSNYSTNKDEKYGQKANHCEALIGEIQKGENTLHGVKTFIKVWGSSLEELNKNCTRLEDLVEDVGMTIRVHVKKQGQAFVATLPISKSGLYGKQFTNYIDKYRFISILMTGNNGMQHEQGEYLGHETNTKSSIIYNAFIGPPELLNPMMMIFGVSGAGKSETLLGMTEREMVAGDWIVYFDLENEAEERVKKMGGIYINIKAGEKTGQNPLDVEIEESSEGKKTIDLYAKRSEMINWLNILKIRYQGEKLNGLEVVTIEEAVRNIYAEKEITKNPDSIYYQEGSTVDGKIILGKVKKKMPQLSDLKMELYKHPYTQEIAKIMEIVTGDGSQAMFDCQTTVSVKKQRLIAYGLKEISDEFTKEFCVINIMINAWSTFSNYQYKHIRKRIKVDEGWFALNKLEIAELLENGERRGRKYKMQIVLGTHFIGDAIDSEAGQSLIKTSATKMIMKQLDQEALKCVKYFNLPEQYDKEIQGFKPGECILLSDNKRTHMQFELIK